MESRRNDADYRPALGFVSVRREYGSGLPTEALPEIVPLVLWSNYRVGRWRVTAAPPTRPTNQSPGMMNGCRRFARRVKFSVAVAMADDAVKKNRAPDGLDL